MTRDDNSGSEWQLNTVIKRTLWEHKQKACEGSRGAAYILMVMESVSTGIHYRRPLKWASIEPLSLEEEGNRSVDSDGRRPAKQTNKKKRQKRVTAEKQRWNFLLPLRLHGGVSHWDNNTCHCLVEKGATIQDHKGEKRINGREWKWSSNKNKSVGILPLRHFRLTLRSHQSAARLAESESHQRVYVLTRNGQWNVSRGPLEHGGVSAASYRCITLNQAHHLQHLWQLWDLFHRSVWRKHPSKNFLKEAKQKNQTQTQSKKVSLVSTTIKVHVLDHR